ncbi:hypothetical protein [Paraburkholderia sacchari]|nr:hypothetical protein [Paraburkholderia sacchari]
MTNLITAWQCDARGALTGTTLVQEDPLEPGVFLLPPHAALNGPPPFDASEGTPVLVDGAWTIRPHEPVPSPEFVPAAPSIPTAQNRPPASEHEIAVIVDRQWKLLPDLRGTTYWLAHGTRHVITEIGEMVPTDATDAPPHPAVPTPTLAQARAAKDTLLRIACDLAVQQPVTYTTTLPFASGLFVRSPMRRRRPGSTRRRSCARLPLRAVRRCCAPIFHGRAVAGRPPGLPVALNAGPPTPLPCPLTRFVTSCAGLFPDPLAMTGDDVTVPIPGTTLHNLLRDYDRLQSLVMQAVSHADARLQDIQRLRFLMRLAARPDSREKQEDVLPLLEQIAERLEAHARDDAALLANALRHHGQRGWPLPTRHPFALPMRH